MLQTLFQTRNRSVETYQSTEINLHSVSIKKIILKRVKTRHQHDSGLDAWMTYFYNFKHDRHAEAAAQLATKLA